MHVESLIEIPDFKPAISFEHMSEWENKLIPYYRGSGFPNQILTLNFDKFKFDTKALLPFNFTGGACSTNDYYIMLCFSNEHERRCYKSKSPIPEHWWHFTLTRKSLFDHNSTMISMSSYNASGKNGLISFILQL